ncbi:MAG: glycosyl transferase family 36 [Candidatus Wallbacteria bacterium]|nr:glycosyl transferase family 36 [Candidatus Wallbacteria bacterium]
MKLLKGKYGHFEDDGKTYLITDWKTPKPWINVISNGKWGLTFSQTGSGYSWLEHAMYNRITRWDQDLISDNHGKYLFLRDDQSGKYWSVTPMPLQTDFDFYECRHGLGYTEITTEFNGIRSNLRVFVPQKHQCEIWTLKLKNVSDKPRKLSVYPLFYPVLDTFPDWHREFHKTFIQSHFDKKYNALVFGKRLWTAPLLKDPGWNKEWPYEMFFMANLKPASFECSREHFLGQYNTVNNAAAFTKKHLSGVSGTGFEQCAAMQYEISLPKGKEIRVDFCLGAEALGQTGKTLARYSKALSNADKLFSESKAFWLEFCEKLLVKTPEPALDVLVNYWLKYQAFSCRVLGRSAYYQCGGAYGFRDQLQDSQLFLSLDPERTKKQILDHASHQRSDGIVQHWWHPVSGEGRINDVSDNLLWLTYVTLEYLDETADNGILKNTVPYLDKGKGTILEHCRKSVDMALSRMSRRGLSLIGEGDWNDGLNGVGNNWKGESIWLSIFLFGILERLAALLDKLGDKKSATKYRNASVALGKAVKKHAFNGKWFDRATDDHGKVLGTLTSKKGKIFVNPQSWAVITGLVKGEEARNLLSQVKKHLYKDYGVLLFTPAFDVPDKNIGYLSRYAPGVRENGGVYTHAAIWTMIAQAKAGNTEMVFETFRRLCPTLLSNADADRYKGEPYVTPGNIEGPESLEEGKGAWTWYSGSAAWLYRAIVEYLLGVRVENDKLVAKPCLPKGWKGFTVERLFRNKKYLVEVKREKKAKEPKIKVHEKK